MAGPEEQQSSSQEEQRTRLQTEKGDTARPKNALATHTVPLGGEGNDLAGRPIEEENLAPTPAVSHPCLRLVLYS